MMVILIIIMKMEILTQQLVLMVELSKKMDTVEEAQTTTKTMCKSLMPRHEH